ncbi:Glutamine--fructose-6-phosphate aminotransferase [isomerizing] [Candidatus Burarchaeum australiense]|nr:Glutamine--fructose-6-phosphate aminotransferase [isomerizing] [Candidatus Burarchaeum australiense]
MCGIVGYIGHRKAAPLILGCLRAHEYRGYDSAGIATAHDGKITVKKGVGKIAEVDAKYDLEDMEGHAGIGHTRWATHGAPSRANAHPITDCTGRLAIVHNGVIENYAEIKKELARRGHKFKSETDTEVAAHLIEEYLKNGLEFEAAVGKAVARFRGNYGFAVLKAGEDKLVLARNGSPLVIGFGRNEVFAASDVPALLRHTREFAFMEDGDLAVIDAKGARFMHDGRPVRRRRMHVSWTADMAQKDCYPHFTIKEIEEQAASIPAALRVDVGRAAKLVRAAKRIHVLGCGTSYHAGLVFKHLLARAAGRECEVFVASEYGESAVMKPGTLVIAVSQSGETIDTMMAVRHARLHRAKVLAITNVVGSSLSRGADANVYINAGPEVGVVATKTFTSQVAVLTKLALAVAGRKVAVNGFAKKVKDVLALSGKMKEIAHALRNTDDFFFIGRSLSAPVAMEGALKLKEIAYVHAEAYSAGELKHGPLSLIAEGIPVIVIAPAAGETHHKLLGNIRECKARGGKIMALSDSSRLLDEGKWKVPMPPVSEELSPLLYTIPLQFLAYYSCLERGFDPDKPRNLAKSVTVE